MTFKIRLIEPGLYPENKKRLSNFFTYNNAINNPSTGLITLATLVNEIVPDTLMYSEAISKLNFEDIVESDIVFISINTYNANRGYEIGKILKRQCDALIVFGGMHASLHYLETIKYCDYILTGDGDESIVEFVKAVQRGQPIDFPGVIFLKKGKVVNTGKRHQPENIDTIPNRNLVFNYAKLAKRYDTLWPQVHASRGCPYSCTYCAVIQHFGKKIRKRDPKIVVADIKEAIAFHERKIIPRINRGLWITDDNFAQDNKWAKSVLNEIINSGIRYNFVVQARIEIGYDFELLSLMRKAGFIEISLGIEFLDDTALKNYKKKNRYSEIVQSIKNIQKTGIAVRGLFIVGSENDALGIGNKIFKFVEDYNLSGALIQSMFFTPGTSFYEENKHKLIHENWQKYNGNVVHFPANIKPHELQKEMIFVSKKIYSVKRLLHVLWHYKWMHKIIFIGDFFWQMNVRKRLKKELPYLKSASEPSLQTVNTPALLPGLKVC